MSASAIAQTATSFWKIDAVHSIAEFKVRHMMISNVKGRFTKITGTLYLDEANLGKSRL
jgi:polyisoprenoid-binding protein YceI